MKTFIECMFKDLDNISKCSEGKIRNELIKMGINIKKVEKKFQARKKALIKAKHETLMKINGVARLQWLIDNEQGDSNEALLWIDHLNRHKQATKLDILLINREINRDNP
jgi:hypothetical protein